MRKIKSRYFETGLLIRFVPAIMSTVFRHAWMVDEGCQYDKGTSNNMVQSGWIVKGAINGIEWIVGGACDSHGKTIIRTTAANTISL
jgi:hypothetical protein